MSETRVLLNTPQYIVNLIKDTALLYSFLNFFLLRYVKRSYSVLPSGCDRGIQMCMYVLNVCQHLNANNSWCICNFTL